MLPLICIVSLVALYSYAVAQTTSTTSACPPYTTLDATFEGLVIGQGVPDSVANAQFNSWYVCDLTASGLRSGKNASHGNLGVIGDGHSCEIAGIYPPENKWLHSFEFGCVAELGDDIPYVPQDCAISIVATGPNTVGYGPYHFKAINGTDGLAKMRKIRMPEKNGDPGAFGYQWHFDIFSLLNSSDGHIMLDNVKIVQGCT